MPLVIGHMGRTRDSEGIDAPGFMAVRRLLARRPDRHTKISIWYRRADAGPPRDDDTRPVAQSLLAEVPQQCVWGANWPHPGIARDMPNDIELLDRLESWLPSDAVREPLFVANAVKLYGFGG